MSWGLSWREYEASRHFPQLDGLRAVSIFMVLTVHMGDPLWDGFEGGSGVTVFFVLSGYLITTLLLRERRANGRVSLAGFYIRRAFRLLPLYYLSLVGYAVALWVAFPDGFARFGDDLWLYLTYNNEFQHGSPFGHTWSLAVEEKFYLLWPMLAFAAPALARHRGRVAGGLTLVAVVAAFLSGWPSYFGLYSGILIGCCVALALDHEATYRTMSRLSSATGAALAVAALVAAVVANGWLPDDLLVAAATGLVIPAIVCGEQWLSRTLRRRPLVWVGERSYAVYLFHPVVAAAVDVVIAPSISVPVVVLRLVIVAALSLAAAEVAHRLVEAPMRDYGRRLAGQRRPATELPPQPVRVAGR